MTAHLSPLALHRLRYGELHGDAAAAARGHLEACPACAGRLREQEQDRADFVLRPVPNPLSVSQAPPKPIRAIAPPPAASWFGSIRGWLIGLTAVTAVGLAVLVPTAETDVTRTRGELPEIEAWVDLGDGPRLLRPDEALSAGARVNLAYDPHGASAVAIAGRDSTGTVEVYTTNAPTGVGLVRAPFALTLDDTPGRQELFVVTSDEPLEPERVRAAVHGEAVDGVSVARVAIEKDP